MFDIARKQEKDIERYRPEMISVYVKKTEVLLREPSLLAFDAVAKKIVGAGREAGLLYGGTNENIVVLNPLKNRIIADYTVAEKLFSILIAKARGKKLTKPQVVICIPSHATEVDGKVFMDAFYQLGAKNVVLSMQTFEEVLAEMPKFCDVVVGIGSGEPEHWEEAFLHEIPADVYSRSLIDSSGQEVRVELTGKQHTVCLRFGAVRSLRMIGKGMETSGLYSEAEIARYRENGFRNVIYQKKYGGHDSFTVENAEPLPWKHYLLVIQDYSLEILADEEPVIEVITKTDSVNTDKGMQTE